ncbi:ORF017L [Largemouth bass ulcerative syndrome virus]|nr:ORF017L [Largemouth bass ulcerative syndrome virus]
MPTTKHSAYYTLHKMRNPNGHHKHVREQQQQQQQSDCVDCHSAEGHAEGITDKIKDMFGNMSTMEIWALAVLLVAMVVFVWYAMGGRGHGGRSRHPNQGAAPYPYHGAFEF